MLRRVLTAILLLVAAALLLPPTLEHFDFNALAQQVQSNASDNASAIWTILFLGFVAVLIIGCFILAFLPAIIAFKRHHPNRWFILFINFFFGWTVIGYFGSFFWACCGPSVVIVQNGSVKTIEHG